MFLIEKIYFKENQLFYISRDINFSDSDYRIFFFLQEIKLFRNLSVSGIFFYTSNKIFSSKQIKNNREKAL